MANTYTLIASNTLSSSAASVTFSSIPNTYTDLVIRMSLRIASTSNNTKGLRYKLNGSTANYSRTVLEGYGTGLFSNRASSTAFQYAGEVITDFAGMTTNTFANTEIYIPNYTVSANKPISVFGVTENNNADYAYIDAHAHLWSNTSAITSIELYPEVDNWKTGSSFFLYGIKNS